MRFLRSYGLVILSVFIVANFDKAFAVSVCTNYGTSHDPNYVKSIEKFDACRSQLKLSNFYSFRTDGCPSMDYLESATDYCQAQANSRLPTVRELAQLATCLGARGIKEMSEFPDDITAYHAGYNPIHAINSDGKVDNFYFSEFGYDFLVMDALSEIGVIEIISSSFDAYYFNKNGLRQAFQLSTGGSISDTAVGPYRAHWYNLMCTLP